METEEKLYIQGFNNGYLLAKHDPELATKLTAQTNDQSDYFQGLISGKNEYDLELEKKVMGFSKGRLPRDGRDLERER